jgi:hypothetical protein
MTNKWFEKTLPTDEIFSASVIPIDVGAKRDFIYN